MKTNSERLATLEEKTDNVANKLDEHMKTSRDAHQELIRRFDNLGEIFVTKDRFAPVEKVVYGLVGIVLAAVLAALVTLVIKK